MAETKPAKKASQQSPKRGNGKASETFTAEEKAAMKERAKEARRAASAAEDERDVLEKIAEMEGSDRVMAERIHAIVKATAPAIAPRTWYGMPAYAKDGNVVCFFKPAQKFKTRYATLGFSDKANLDEGTMWATEYAVTEMSTKVEARIRALVEQAVS
jgi:uncharacterized protein YdhG (YjbR/CyaY superfamily)